LLIAACDHWFTCGLFGGQRLSELAIDDTHKMLNNPTLNYHSDPKAFCLEVSCAGFHTHPSCLSGARALNQGLFSPS
jgi:hypothetical protein